MNFSRNNYENESVNVCYKYRKTGHIAFCVERINKQRDATVGSNAYQNQPWKQKYFRNKLAVSVYSNILFMNK